MIYRCSLYEETEMRQWDDFVRSHPNGTPFHLHDWIKTIHESYNYEPHLYAFKDDSGIITSIFPLFVIKNIIKGYRVISLPFSDFGGPLCCSSEEEKELLAKVIDLFGKNCRHMEIRSDLTVKDTFIREEFYKHHVLRLANDACVIYNRFDKKTIQYSIRKAQKSGVEVKEESNPRGIEAFYELNRKTRKKHGIPHQPKRFFENIYKNMFSDGRAFLLLARSDSKVIAGGLFFKMNGTVHYKYNASDQEFLTEKRPNHLLTWHAIEKACVENYELFDFGRTSPCDCGLMRYKEMWGAEAFELPYFHYPKIKGLSCAKTVDSNLMGILKKWWKWLPEPVVDGISSRIYKYLA